MPAFLQDGNNVLLLERRETGKHIVLFCQLAQLRFIQAEELVASDDLLVT